MISLNNFSADFRALTHKKMDLWPESLQLFRCFWKNYYVRQVYSILFMMELG